MNTEWIWNHLHKVNHVDPDDYYTSLLSGFVTDGFGNVYRLPKTGRLPLRSINNDKEYKFTYNWETREIEVYVYDLGADNSEVDNYIYLASYSVSPENFVDNPDYWYNTALSELHSEVEGELENIKASEAYELYGEIIDEDKDEYVYNVLFDYEALDLDLSNAYSSWEEYFHHIEKVLSEYKPSTNVLFGEKIDVKCVTSSFMSDEGNKLEIKFSMPLTKEDILDIWNEFEDYSNNVLPNVHLDISDIVEV